MISAAVSSWFSRRFSRAAAHGLVTRRSHSHYRSNLGSDAKFPFPWRRAVAQRPPQHLVSLSIHRSINDVDRAEWDEIVGADGLLRSHAYLAAVEASAVDARQFFYPVYRDSNGAIVAHACVYIIDTDLAQVLPPSLAWLPKIVRKFWRRFLIVGITECASPLSTSHSISIDPSVDRDFYIREIANTVTDIARNKQSRLIVVRDFLSSERREFDSLLLEGFNLVSNMPLARLRIRWDTYEGYLADMRSRYRKDVKRRLKRAAASGQRVRVANSFSEQSILWAEQARVVQQNTKGFKRETLTPAYYENIDALLGDKSLLVIADREGASVAHGMVLNDDSVSIATYFGRNSGPANHEWFHLVNEVIKIAIDNKSEYINLGMGSYDAKSNVGADVEPLFVYAKSTLTWVNWLMRAVPGTMDRHIDDGKYVFHE